MPPKPTSPISLQSNDRRIMLVPYLKHHVPRYHEWMKDPFIQQQTASEPLTLDEELEMQQEWMRDPLKHTFIVLFQQSIGGRGGGGGEEEGAVETKNMAAVDSYAFPGAVMVGYELYICSS